MTILSPDQNVAVNNIQKFLNWNADTDKHILTGGPGNGKSFLIAEVMKRNPNTNIILAALTHKAAKVLRDFAGHHEVFTLHKLLSLIVIQDWVKNTTKVIDANRKDDILDCCLHKKTLVIVDEVSMIDSVTNFHIDMAIKRYQGNIKFLLVGDEDQVPSVEDGESIIFNSDIPTSRLTTIHRQDSDSTIPYEANKLRSTIQSNSYLLEGIEESKNIQYLEHEDFLEQMQAEFCTAKMMHDMETVKALAYRNKTVNAFNKLIRGYFFEDPELQQGEVVVLNKAFSSQGDMVPTESIMEIEDNQLLKGFYDIEGRLITADFEGQLVQGVLTDEKNKINRIRKQLIADRKFKELKEFMESFIDVRPVYSATVHKSQGSTYNNTFIHLEDICECRDYDLIPRLLYVALTRAKGNVYLYGEIPKHLLKA